MSSNYLLSRKHCTDFLVTLRAPACHFHDLAVGSRAHGAMEIIPTANFMRRQAVPGAKNQQKKAVRRWTILGGKASVVGAALALASLILALYPNLTSSSVSLPATSASVPTPRMPTSTTSTSSAATALPSPTLPPMQPETSTAGTTQLPPSVSSPPAVRWQGELTVGNYNKGGLKDLDQAPPLPVVHDNVHGDIWFATAGDIPNTLYAVDRESRMAKWDRGSPAPTYEDCQRQSRSGITKYALYPGDVLCARTSEGRTALLVTTTLPPSGAAPGSLATFNVTVWEPAT